MLRRALIAAALGSLASGQQAHAATAGKEFLAAVLGSLPRQGESFACFSRQYDDAQLAVRPRQKVAFVKALIAAYYRESSFAPESGAYSYQVSLAFRFRDRADLLTGSRSAARGG